MMRIALLLPAALALAATAGALLYGSAGAQSLSEEAAALAAAKRDAVRAARRAGDYEVAAQRATDAADRARAEAAAVAAQVQVAEADIVTAQTRVRLIEALRARQHARLAARQGPVVRLTAAIQTMALRPPALALVNPGSVTDIVHVRTLLDATLPVIRQRTAALRVELAAAERLRREAGRAERMLRDGRRRLEQQRVSLARLEAAQRIRSQSLTDAAMYQQDRSIALGEEARDITDLMQSIERQSDVGDRLSQLPGPVLRPALPANARLPGADAAPVPRGPPRYRLPVIGKVVSGLGEVSDMGVRARGLTLRTAPAALVVAPAEGRIAFAGPFDGYGRIVIIDHGGGWTTLVTDLASLSVRVGDAVDGGSPIGHARRNRPRVTIELRERSHPADIVPLLSQS